MFFYIKIQYQPLEAENYRSKNLCFIILPKIKNVYSFSPFATSNSIFKSVRENFRLSSLLIYGRLKVLYI
jgi:hypothetical protein